MCCRHLNFLSETTKVASARLSVNPGHFQAAFGFTSFQNYRIRTLLYAGKPNWDLLPTITPR